MEEAVLVAEGMLLLVGVIMLVDEVELVGNGAAPVTVGVTRSADGELVAKAP